MIYDSLMMKGDFIMRDLYWLSSEQLSLIQPYFSPSRGGASRL